MEKRTNNRDLYFFGLTTPGQQIFYQKWRELVCRSTLDSYKARVLNAHGSLLEIIEIVNSVQREGIHVANLSASQEECRDLVRDDYSIGVHARHLKGSLLNRLSHKILRGDDKGSAPKGERTTEKAALSALKFHVSSALNLIKGQYLTWVLDDLKIAIDQDKLATIETLLASVASEAARGGWSTYRLYKWKGIFEDSKKSFDDKWVRFVGLLQRSTSQFCCLLPVSQEVATDVLGVVDSGVTIKTGAEIKNQFPQAQLTIGQTQHFIYQNVAAMDHEGAFLSALGLINRSLNVLTFFEKLDPWPAASPRAVVIDTVEEEFQELDYNHITREWARVEHSPKVLEAALSATKNSSIDPRSLERLHGALLYAKLSGISPSQEVRFMNLWVALESFVRTGQHENIIDHVKATVPSATSARYFHRILRNFAEDCGRCGVRVTTASGPLDLNQPKSEVAAQILEVLRDPTFGQSALRSCAAENTLLARRCEAIMQMVEEGKSAAKALSDHHERVSRHLQRLYRVRNAIAHSGYGSFNSLTTYIRNVKEYLSLTIVEAVYHMDSGKLPSLEEIFSALENNHLATVEALKTSDKTYSSKLLLEGALFSMV